MYEGKAGKEIANKVISAALQRALTNQATKRLGKFLDRVWDSAKVAWEEQRSGKGKGAKGPPPANDEKRTGRRDGKRASGAGVTAASLRVTPETALDSTHRNLAEALIELGFEKAIAAEAVEYVLATANEEDLDDLQLLLVASMRECKARSKRHQLLVRTIDARVAKEVPVRTHHRRMPRRDSTDTHEIDPPLSNEEAEDRIDDSSGAGGDLHTEEHVERSLE